MASKCRSTRAGIALQRPPCQHATVKAPGAGPGEPRPVHGRGRGRVGGRRPERQGSGVRACPTCGSHHIHRSHRVFPLEYVRSLTTRNRPYRCRKCGWRGWGPRSSGQHEQREIPETSRQRSADIDEVFAPLVDVPLVVPSVSSGGPSPIDPDARASGHEGHRQHRHRGRSHRGSRSRRHSFDDDASTIREMQTVLLVVCVVFGLMAMGRACNTGVQGGSPETHATP
jgi:predicted RNA-binding Zn-ribbon protein involved in translation (DUF1610 family)